MQTHICATCGSQFSPSPDPPADCPICEDERQYVGLHGQEWITLEKLRQKYRNFFFQEGPGIWGVQTEPKFGIGQRALLVQTGAQNILWDCVSLIDADTVELVRALGGISAIAVSHPHYYSSMVEWSHCFGNVPVFLHADDRHWVQRPDPVIQFWTGETHSIGDGLMLIRVGGHFTGYQALHWAGAENGAGRAIQRRYAASLPGSPVGELYVQLPELYASECADRPPYRRDTQPLQVYEAVRRLGGICGRRRRAASRAEISRTISSRDWRKHLAISNYLQTQPSTPGRDALQGATLRGAFKE